MKFHLAMALAVTLMVFGAALENPDPMSTMQ